MFETKILDEYISFDLNEYDLSKKYRIPVNEIKNILKPYREMIKDNIRAKILLERRLNKKRFKKVNLSEYCKVIGYDYNDIRNKTITCLFAYTDLELRIPNLDIEKVKKYFKEDIPNLKFMVKGFTSLYTKEVGEEVENFYRGVADYYNLWRFELEIQTNMYNVVFDFTDYDEVV